MFYADTTQDHFAYNVKLDSMDEKGNSYYWELQNILGHKKKKDQTIHLKIEWPRLKTSSARFHEHLSEKQKRWVMFLQRLT